MPRAQLAVALDVAADGRQLAITPLLANWTEPDKGRLLRGAPPSAALAKGRRLRRWRQGPLTEGRQQQDW